jgi:hypothetical protein
MAVRGIYPRAREAQQHPIPQPPQLGPSSKFGFKNPLPFFNLLQPGSVLPHHADQHKFGPGHGPPIPQENPLPFFSLLATFPVEHPTHNRAL